MEGIQKGQRGVLRTDRGTRPVEILTIEPKYQVVMLKFLDKPVFRQWWVPETTVWTFSMLEQQATFCPTGATEDQVEALWSICK